MGNAHNRFQTVVAVAGLLLIVPLAANAQNYTFRKIACSYSSGFVNLGWYPTINNNGTIAFWAYMDDGNWAMYTARDGTFTRIVDTNDIFSDWPPLLWRCPVINDAGTVAFQAKLSAGGEGIFTADGNSITTIADTTTLSVGGNPPVFFGQPSINNAGTVAFAASFSPSSPVYTVFTGSGGPLTTIATDAGDNPSINDGGTVAYAGTGLPGWGSAIFTTAGRLIVDQNLHNLVREFYAINNAGAVAFEALEAGSVVGGIYIGCGNLDLSGIPSLNTVVDTHGPYDRIHDVALNDAGTVAFAVHLDDRRFGIFTGPDPVADKVIATGDTLLGQIVSDVRFARDGLNQKGQIVFTASLMGFAECIFVADPCNPATPAGPLLPVNPEPPWRFVFDIPCNAPTYDCPPPVVIDPQPAIGYDYQLDVNASDANFAAVAPPANISDDSFNLYIWDGNAFVFEQVLAGGEQFFFELSGVDRFRILGIEPTAGLDPNDPLAFQTHLCFTGCGHIEMTMTPLTAPEICIVDFYLFAKFAEHWLKTQPGLPGDLDWDNDVDRIDLRLFVLYWLDCCPPSWPLK